VLQHPGPQSFLGRRGWAANGGIWNFYVPCITETRKIWALAAAEQQQLRYCRVKPKTKTKNSLSVSWLQICKGSAFWHSQRVRTSINAAQLITVDDAYFLRTRCVPLWQFIWGFFSVLYAPNKAKWKRLIMKYYLLIFSASIFKTPHCRRYRK